jgi:hypothetical protein
MSEPLCANCGHPRNNHPFRHPFAGPSKDDTIKELETKLAKAMIALKFYADLETYEQNAEPPYQNGFFAIELDEGKVARAALAEIEGEKE